MKELMNYREVYPNGYGLSVTTMKSWNDDEPYALLDVAILKVDGLSHEVLDCITGLNIGGLYALSKEVSADDYEYKEEIQWEE